MDKAVGPAMPANMANGQPSAGNADLDEKVAFALGDLSTRACVIDKQCRAHKVPAYVGDYLLARYGDDEVGLHKAARVLFSAYVVSQGKPPIINATVCRIFGMRRMGDDVYGVTTPCPLLFKMGIEGHEIRTQGLLDGSWCHLSISRQTVEGITVIDLLDDDSQDDLAAPSTAAYYSVDSLRPVREEAGSVQRLLDLRSRLTTKEWALLLLRSYGLGGEELELSEQTHLLSRLAPLAEPGLRVLYVRDGECDESNEMSPYEVTADQLTPDLEGLPGSWDCVVADGDPDRGAYGLSVLLDGYEGVAAGTSIAAIAYGSEEQESRHTRLFGPFHLVVRTPRATEGDRKEVAAHLGVNRCLLGELWHGLRNRDMPPEALRALEDAPNLHGTRREAVALVLAGIAKVLYPTGRVPKTEARDLLEFALSQT